VKERRSLPEPSAASPIFVFGADHSGTTILYRMLAHHPQLVWFSQFTLRNGRVPGRSRRPGAQLLEPLVHSTVRRFASHSWGKAELGALRRLVVPRPGEEGKIWDHLLERPGDPAERVRDSLTAWASRFPGRRILAKRPAFYRHLEALQRAFPEASFVHVVRDGRPVALSLRAKGLDVGYVHRPTDPLPGPDPAQALRAGAEHWVDVLEHVASAPAIDLLEVRYEDLCADTHGVVASILDHADVDRETFPYPRCPSTLNDQGGRWLERASGDELAEIDAIEGRFLLQYGYREAAAAAGRARE
jgi:hypothetical protein